MYTHTINDQGKYIQLLTANQSLQKRKPYLKISWEPKHCMHQVIVVVVVVGTYFEYMAVKPFIVPSYRYNTFFSKGLQYMQ